MQKIEVVDIYTGNSYSWVSHEESQFQEGTVQNMTVYDENGMKRITAKIVRCEYLD